MIASFTEGLIEKDQFTSRMARIKGRIAEPNDQIQAYSSDIDQLEHLRIAVERSREIAATIMPNLVVADWLSCQRKMKVTKFGLRKCIRPSMELITPGQDGMSWPRLRGRDRPE
jgi:hypothetical protein